MSRARSKGKKTGFTTYVPANQPRPTFQRSTEVKVQSNRTLCGSTTFVRINDKAAGFPSENISAGGSDTISHEVAGNEPGFETQLLKAFTEMLETLPAAANQSKRKRAPAYEAMGAWIPMRDSYLEEMIGLEGRHKPEQASCNTCSCNDTGAPGPALFECGDCCTRELQCQRCIVRDHEHLPLHRIREWNGSYFINRNLKDLGLRIQLGHHRGERCIVREQCHADDFVIIDITGIHPVGLDFCGCGKSVQSRAQQLLRSRLFPATVAQPRTAATFSLLRLYELLSYESKASVFEFYQTLARVTDNTRTKIPRDRYPVFLRIANQWRHLHMMKRAGRGHDPSGIAATQEGECALLCPACPHPGKNMPDGWEKAEPSERYRHALFVALDGNFRLKRKNVSSDTADPGLNRGYAYVVEEMAYKKHLLNYKNEEEPKTSCSRHDAVLLSDAKPSRGHAATGVCAIECSRHDMKRPQSIGDLQRGERYCNVDYIFSQSLQDDNALKTFYISYDIACQWSVNLEARLSVFRPSFFLFEEGVASRFLVPKFHLPAHILSCRNRYSFNYTQGVGRTEGEAPERGWAEANPLAASTREMGPGTRRDTLDYHFGDCNWRKITDLAVSLAEKLWKAAISMAEHAAEHAQLETTIPHSNLRCWQEEIEAWERNPNSVRNPYESIVQGPTLVSVERQLAEEEKHALTAGKDMSLDEKITPSILIKTGIELEIEQSEVKREVSKVWAHAGDRQRTHAQLRLNTLQRKINAWCGYQILYVPSIATLRHSLEQSAIAKGLPEQPIYDFPLWLPSQIKAQVPFNMSLAEIEWKIREAQAHEALERVRRCIQIRAHLYRFKRSHVRGQGACTRTLNAINVARGNVNSAAAEYRVAHAALRSLSTLLGKEGWMTVLRPLEDADLRELSEAEEGVSEGNRKISWIWTSANPSADINNNPELRETVKIEWCKSRARTRAFKEEVTLLIEEMGRVCRFFRWKECDWKEKGDTWQWGVDLTSHRMEALRAYAFRQADIYRTLRLHAESLWQHLPEHVAKMNQAKQDPSVLEKFMEEEFETNSKGIRKRKKRRKVWVTTEDRSSDSDASILSDLDDF